MLVSMPSDRQTILEELDVLDTPPELEYDDLAALAAAVFRSDAAAVNFVDAERQWTKASTDPDGHGAEVPAEASFCAALVEGHRSVLVVEDTHADPAWRDHPSVVGGPRVRFYAGVPIVVAHQRVGAVCSYGTEPRAVEPREVAGLEALARQAAARLELRLRNSTLRALATTDHLTGLANRTLLEDRLTLALAHRERHGREVGVVFCDVDGLKDVNDRFGHEAGDRLLRDVGDVLRAVVRGIDTVARISGDEFVVVCPQLADPAELELVAARIAALEGGHVRRPDGQPAGLSVGTALAQDGDDVAAVLRRADLAMYRAKLGGGQAV